MDNLSRVLFFTSLNQQAEAYAQRQKAERRAKKKVKKANNPHLNS